MPTVKRHWVDLFSSTVRLYPGIITQKINVDCHTALQSQKAVSTYFLSKQILPFGFARQYRPWEMGDIRLELYEE